VLRGCWRESLTGAQAQESASRQTLTERAERALLERPREVNEDVPTKHHLHLAKGMVRRQVVAEQHDVLPQSLFDRDASVRARAVVVEVPLATRAQIVLRE
jgi:hypothetical protein